MIAQWVSSIVGEMHVHQIEHRVLAKQLGVTPQYVSMVLNGKRDPAGAEERFKQALDELLKGKEDRA